jgi:hypothetical protein
VLSPHAVIIADDGVAAEDQQPRGPPRCHLDATSTPPRRRRLLKPRRPPADTQQHGGLPARWPDAESHVTTQIDQTEALAAAERTAVATLLELAPSCRHRRVLSGNTKRGPAFVYACEHCDDVSLISVPAGGLRNREPGDPTSRTRISTFTFSSVILETGAFIESDGTVRARFVVHVPGHAEPDWDLTVDHAESVGEAVAAIRHLPAVPRQAVAPE